MANSDIVEMDKIDRPLIFTKFDFTNVEYLGSGGFGSVFSAEF